MMCRACHFLIEKTREPTLDDPMEGCKFLINKNLMRSRKTLVKEGRNGKLTFLQVLLHCCWREENIGRRTNFGMGVELWGSPGGGVHF